MIDTIYVEDELKENANAEDIIRRINPKNLILCESYKEVFNKKSQNFKLQKKNHHSFLQKKKITFYLKFQRVIQLVVKKISIFRICLIVFMTVVIVFYRVCLILRIM